MHLLSGKFNSRQLKAELSPVNLAHPISKKKSNLVHYLEIIWK